MHGTSCCLNPRGSARVFDTPGLSGLLFPRSPSRPAHELLKRRFLPDESAGEDVLPRDPSEENLTERFPLPVVLDVEAAVGSLRDVG